MLLTNFICIKTGYILWAMQKYLVGADEVSGEPRIHRSIRLSSVHCIQISVLHPDLLSSVQMQYDLKQNTFNEGFQCIYDYVHVRPNSIRNVIFWDVAKKHMCSHRFRNSRPMIGQTKELSGKSNMTQKSEHQIKKSPQN